MLNPILMLKKTSTSDRNINNSTEDHTNTDSNVLQIDGRQSSTENITRLSEKNEQTITVFELLHTSVEFRSLATKLKLIGIMYYHPNDHWLIRIWVALWYPFLRLSILCFLVFILADYAALVSGKTFEATTTVDIDNGMYMSYIFMCTIFEALSLFMVSNHLFPTAFNVGIADPMFVGFLEESQSVVGVFFITLVLSLLVYPILGAAYHYQSPLESSNSIIEQLYYPTIFLGELSQCCIVTGVFLLFSAKTRYCRYFIDGMIVSCHQQMLTLATFKKTKEALDEILLKDAWSYRILSVVAAFNVLAFLLKVFTEDNLVFSLSGAFMYYFKAFLFAFVMYWRAARLNNTADMLTLQLSQSVWDATNDQERILIWICAIGNPFSCVVLSIRWTKQYFYNYLFSFIIALIIGLGRKIVIEALVP